MPLQRRGCGCTKNVVTMLDRERTGAATKAVKTNPEFIKALGLRGITETDLVAIECWPGGRFDYDDKGTGAYGKYSSAGAGE